MLTAQAQVTGSGSRRALECPTPGVRRGLVSQALPWHEHSYVDTRALASWSSKNGRALERAQDEHEPRGRDTKSHTCVCMVVSSTDTTSGGLPRVASLCARVCLYTRELIDIVPKRRETKLALGSSHSECCRSAQSAVFGTNITPRTGEPLRSAPSGRRMIGIGLRARERALGTCDLEHLECSR